MKEALCINTCEYILDSLQKYIAKAHAGEKEELATKGRRQRHNVFSYRVAQRWNLLPAKLKTALSLSSFKNCLNEIILGNCVTTETVGYVLFNVGKNRIVDLELMA